MGATEKLSTENTIPITERLAGFITDVGFNDLPSEVVRLAKNSFLDTLGLALVGMTEAAPKVLSRFIQEQGGAPVATVLTQKFKTNAPNAALVNGTAGDILGWSDISVIQMTHPSVSICPAVWALGEQLHASGKAAILAHVLGVEIADKLGAGIRPRFQLKGWHPLAVLNTVGAAAAGGKLLGLDAIAIGNALGIAGAEASGMRVAMGTMSKAYGAGRSARDGLVAARLAGLGYTGPRNVIEGRDGFLQTFGEGADGKGILENLGNPYEFISPGITLKKFPACTRSHNGIHGVLTLKKRYGFTPDDIQSVECLVTPAVVDYLKFPRPKSKFEAKYSMEFCIATAIRDGKVVASSFTDEKTRDPELLGLLARVKMSIWPEYSKHGYNPPHAPYGCLVNITLRNGQRYSLQVDSGPWEPATPPSWEDLEEKFRGNAELVLPRSTVDNALDMIAQLEKLEDIGAVMALLKGD